MNKFKKLSVGGTQGCDQWCDGVERLKKSYEVHNITEDMRTQMVCPHFQSTETPKENRRGDDPLKYIHYCRGVITKSI